MQLKPEQLDQALQQGLKPVYLVYGDEALLREESADKIRQAARANGANEREVWHVEGRFDWSQIKWQEQSLSLFASQRLIEIRLPSGSPGKEGGEALRRYAADPPADTTLLIISGKIESRSQQSKWFKELDRLGVRLPIWPLETERLPRWIEQRMQQRGLVVDKSLALLIAERVEGNLYAAAQEVDKLQLLSLSGQLDEQTIMDSVADNARFEAFGLMDAVMAGECHKIPRMIARLRNEGAEVLAVFSAISWSLHRLINMSLQLQRGQSMEQVCNEQKPALNYRNKPLIQAALRRYNSAQWQQLLVPMSRIDQAAKGMGDESAWVLLENICLQAAGVDMPLLAT